MRHRPDTQTRLGRRLSAFLLSFAPVLFLLAGSLAFDGCTASISQSLATLTSDRGPSRHSTIRTAKDLRNDPGDFQFAVMSDRNGGCRPGIFEDAVGKLNLLQPEFVMSIGDLIGGYTDDKAQLDAQWKEFDEIVGRLEMPFFYVPGNHDVHNPATRAKWMERFKRTYYSFVYRDVLFLCLDSDRFYDPDGWEDQVKFVSRVLARHKDARWTIVFLHHPLWEEENPPAAWEQIQKAFQGRPHSIFAGHWHQYAKSTRDGHTYIRLATTGGGSDLGGADVGELDQVVWVAMTDAGPRIANLALEGIHDENMLTEEGAREIGWFNAGAWFDAKPVIVDRPLMEDAASTILLTNSSASTLTLRAVVAASSEVGLTTQTIERILAPGANENVQLAFHPAKPVEVDSLAPLTVDMSAAWTLPSGKPLNYGGPRGIPFDYLRPCPRLARAPKVDGLLDDWTGGFIDCPKPAMIQGPAQEWTGPEDCRLRFALGHDDEYLYVAVESFDDQAFVGADKERWRQDALRVYLDANNDPERSQDDGRWADRFTRFFILEAACGKGPGNPDVFEPERMPEGTKTAIVQTPTGLAAELAIPVSYLNERQGAPWKAVRINVAVKDHDKPEDKGFAYWWKPRWDNALSYPGSGTFVPER